MVLLESFAINISWNDIFVVLLCLFLLNKQRKHFKTAREDFLFEKMLHIEKDN